MTAVNTKTVNSFKQVAEPKIMLFDLAVEGHHPSYIRHLITYWHDEALTGSLFVVVSPTFFQDHANVVNLSNSSTKFVAISSDEATKLAQTKSIIQQSFLEWKLHCKYAKELQVNHSLLMYFDHLQLPIVMGQKSPCSFSGIYFRPTFHYKYFANYTPCLKDLWRAWRQKVLLFFTLKNKQLKALLTLDSYAIKHIKLLASSEKIVKHIADPVLVPSITHQQTQKLRADLGIDEQKKVFLLLGHVCERKGIFQVLEAMRLLPQHVADQCCLLLVGKISQSIRLKLLANIDSLLKTSPVQAMVIEGYQPEEKISLYFSMTNYVLALYQKHVGMSGVVILGAAYQKPILASNYGLIGKIVCDQKLGYTLDSTSPREISKHIEALANGSVLKDYLPHKSNFSRQNHSPKKFSCTAFESVSQKPLSQ
ncbi:MAG: glycosyltransferase [Almyronema sp.]